MKKYFLTMATVALFAIGFAASDEEENSSNSSNDSSKPQTEQKQEQKKESQEVKSEQKQENSFLGTYEVTDKSGTKLTLNINEDETVTGSDNIYPPYYGSWTGSPSEGIIIITFAEGNKPYLTYEGGEDNHASGVLYLRDGWIYTGGDNAYAKNPKWRLKVTKIK